MDNLTDDSGFITLEMIEELQAHNLKLTDANVRLSDEILSLQKRVSDADECIEEQEEMLENLIVDQGKYKKEIERLQAKLEQIDNHITNRVRDKDAEIERLQYANECLKEARDLYCIEMQHLRTALAKSCEEGRDEMYDCGYNRLRAALEEISEGKGRYSKDPLTHASNTIEDMIEIAREALKDDL